MDYSDCGEHTVVCGHPVRQVVPVMLARGAVSPVYRCLAPQPFAFLLNDASRCRRIIMTERTSSGTRPTIVATPAAASTVSAFVAVRPRLFAIAYRILGSATAAEDVVQDAWLRWQATDRRPVLNAPAYFATATKRLAINVIHSARARCETSVGRWLTEPVDTRPDPHLEVQRREALEHAFLLLLERLSPRQRAAYVLREAFNYPYRQIARILRVAEPNARQLVTRARKRVADKPPMPRVLTRGASPAYDLLGECARWTASCR